MQSTTHGTSRDQRQVGQPGIMTVSNKTSDDDSGLHDLKALASSTKQRRSQRLSSQMEAQDSLLQSAASLEAVALPDPDKEQPISLEAVAIADAPLATGAVAQAGLSTPLASAAQTSIGTPPASGSKILLLGGLVILAAGAVAFYMMRGGAGDSGESSVSAANAVVVPAAADEAEEAAPVEPAAEEVAIAADESADELTASADEDAAAILEEAPADEKMAAEDELVDTKKNSKSEKSAKTEKGAKSEKSEAAIAKAEARAAAKAEAKAARDLAKAEKKAAAKADEKAPTLGEGGASLDDVLSSVTGGVDKPIVDDKKDDTPSKKKLERGDIAKAMKGITPAAKSCYSAEEFTGTVMVKYSVSPSGKMTKSTAMGAHKSSKTGKCVLNAVKKAKFPAFSGATQSFTFPFLLSP